MAEDKVVVTLDSFEQRLMVSALTDIRNELLPEEKPTDHEQALLPRSSRRMSPSGWTDANTGAI